MCLGHNKSHIHMNATFCFPDTALHPELVESPRGRRAFSDVTTEEQRLLRNRAFRQDSAAVFNVHAHGQVILLSIDLLFFFRNFNLSGTSVKVCSRLTFAFTSASM